MIEKSKTNNPLVTVNILSFNRKDELRYTLTKVFDQDYKNIEVIVVDNASSDGTQQMVQTEFPQVNLIELEENIGIAGWNKGFEVAKGEYVLVLDDDSYPLENTINAGIKAFRDNVLVAVVAFNIINYTTGISENILLGEHPISFIGCGAMISMTIVTKMKGFCKLYFIYHNELDLSARIRDLGYDILFLKNGRVIHKKNIINDYQIIRNKERFASFTQSTYIFILLRLSGREKIRTLIKWTINRLLIALLYSYLREFLHSILIILQNKKNIKIYRLTINIALQTDYGSSRFPLVSRSFFPYFDRLKYSLTSIHNIFWLFVKNVYSFLRLKLFLKIFRRKSIKPNPNKIILVNMGYLGEIIISSIFFENAHLLKEDIHLLVQEKYLNVFSTFGKRDKIIGLNLEKYKKSFIYKLKFINKLRKEGFEISLNLTPFRTNKIDELALLIGFRSYALKLDSTRLFKPFSKNIDKIYDKIIYSDSINEYEKIINTVRFFIGKHDVDITVYSKTILDYSKVVSQKFTFRRYIVIAPFSSKGIQDWSLSNFIKLTKLLKELNYYIVFIGDKTQYIKIQRLINIFGHKRNEYLFGDYSLAHISKIISGAKMYLGLDSGLSHIALKTNVRMIAIIGGGSFNRFFPFLSSKRRVFVYEKLRCFNCEWRCIFQEKYCLTKIEVEHVYYEVVRLLEIEE